MAYNKKTWVTGETIEASALNNMEDGIEAGQNDELEKEVEQNTTNIATNKENISQNTSDIEQNTSDIKQNASDISSLSSDITELNSALTDYVSVSSFYTDSVTVEASDATSVTISGISKSGYTALSIVNVSITTASSGGANPSRVYVYNASLSGTTATVNVRNTHTSDAVVKVTVYVLFVKQ